MRRVPLLAMCALGLTMCGRSPARPPETAATLPAAEVETPPATAREWNPWEDARSRGIDFRALGNEPGWLLEVDHDRSMRLFYANAERMVTASVSSPFKTGEATSREAAADGHTVRVAVFIRECSDTMSDERYPATVTVTLDGLALHGCGRWMNP